MVVPPLLARLLIQSGVVRLFPGLQRRLEGGVDYLRYWSDRLLTSPLDQLERIAPLIQPETPDVIDLAGGTPRFDFLPSAPARLGANRRGWPDVSGLPELRSAVATYLFSENEISVNPADEVLITAGAFGAGGILFDAFVNRGDSVVLLDPVSPLYPMLARTRGARIRWVHTRTDEGRLRLRFDHLVRGLRGARVLVLCSPSNPTGGIIAPEDLELISWWAQRNDTLILSDEVFQRFSYDDAVTSIASFAQARQRTLTVGSVSKSHGLAWARVGWIAGCRHLLRACRATAALRCPFVPTLSQMIAVEALRQGERPFETLLQQLDSRRKYVYDRLCAMGLSPVWPVGGFFFWVPVPEVWQTGNHFAEILLTSRRVRVVPGDLFGPSGTKYIRISYVAEEGRLEEGLNRMGELLRGDRQRLRAMRMAG